MWSTARLIQILPVRKRKARLRYKQFVHTSLTHSSAPQAMFHSARPIPTASSNTVYIYFKLGAIDPLPR